MSVLCCYLTSLQEQGIEDVYIEILKDIYTGSSVTVHLHKESENIRIKRGVRQGDTISHKLFTATLESIIRRLTWENKGVKIDGEFLSNLRFADDIFLCTETPQELKQMLQELSDESWRMGLKMNIAKTKVMVVDNTLINVNNVLIENVQGYVYLGQHYSLKEKNQDKEIQRRIMAGWAAYAKHRDIFKSNLAICLKRQVYNSCVLPAMTYGAETWTLTKQAQNKLAARRPKWKEVCSTSHTKIERPTSGSGEDKSHRYNPHCKKNEMVLGRAYQPPQRRPMDLACHHLETI